MTGNGGSGEDVARIRAERDQLQAEVEKIKNAPERRMRMRRITAGVLVALTLLFVALGVPGAWARRTLLDTDRYVATVGPLASDPAIQETLATEITNHVFAALDVEARLRTVLGERASRLAFLAGPITNAVEGFVHDQVLKVVQSDAFATLWVEANEFAHSQAMAVLRGDTEELVLIDGKLVFNYLPLVNEALAKVTEVAADLIGGPVSLPEITSDTVPAEAIVALELAFGVDLPDTFGQLTLHETDALGTAQQALRAVNAAVYLLILLVIGCFAGALWLSPRKRRTLLQLSIGIAAVVVLERRLAIIGAGGIVEAASDEFAPATQSLVDSLLGSLLKYTGWILAIMLVTAIGALLSGPYPWAVSARGWAGSLTGAVEGADLGPAGAWVAEHRDGLMVAVGVVALGVWFFADLSFLGFVVLVVLTALLEVLVSRTAASTVDDRMGDG